MSVLGRRLAATEGAYFLQESKIAAGRLVAQKKTKKGVANNKGDAPSPFNWGAEELSADVLPEVLRHSVPLIHEPEAAGSSFAGGSKWALGDVPASSPRLVGVINPLRDYVSLPQVSFGPKRWQLPDAQSCVLASTANELRRDRYSQPADPETLKAAVAGLTQIGKAFAIATAIIFGGATAIFALTASKLQIQNTDDIRTRGRDVIQPRAELVRERMAPFRTWAENWSRKWRSAGDDEAKGNPLVQQLSKILGRRDM